MLISKFITENTEEIQAKRETVARTLIAAAEGFSRKLVPEIVAVFLK